jgi:hypothetical protein
MTNAQEVQLSSIVVRSDAPLSADVGGEIVLMSMERGKYYDLDTISSDIWRRLSQPMQVAALCGVLAEEYEGELATIQTDVMALLRQFADHGLIQVQGS